MAGNAIAEVHAPRKRGRASAGMVFQAGQKTADTANRNSDRERNSEEVTGSPFDSEILLCQLHREEPANQRSNNRFAAHQIRWIAPVRQRGGWIFKPIQHLATNHGAYRR